MAINGLKARLLELTHRRMEVLDRLHGPNGRLGAGAERDALQDRLEALVADIYRVEDELRAVRMKRMEDAVVTGLVFLSNRGLTPLEVVHEEVVEVARWGRRAVAAEALAAEAGWIRLFGAEPGQAMNVYVTLGVDPAEVFADCSWPSDWPEASDLFDALLDRVAEVHG